MPKPHPLTLCPPAQLDWSRPGTPAATDFGDIYFSTDGGLEETRTVFLKGCCLPEAWQDTQRFVIGELGFGSGLNFLAAWQLWEKTKPRDGYLHFVSIEKFPFDRDQLKQALEAWPELARFSNQLIQQWPDRVKGFHRLHFEDVTLTLVHDDISAALQDMDMQANAWFLDGFSPAKNPDMWSENIMRGVARLSAPGARLATFTAAGSVRDALSKAGFHLERKEGFGRKRHRLEAVYKGQASAFSYSDRQPPLIIGSGIAGLSFAEALLRRGQTAKLIEDKDHIAASGNPAALIKPRLDLQDRPESRFFLSSYLYALKRYENVQLIRGIHHLAKDEKEVQRHNRLLDQNPLPSSHLAKADNDHLFFPLALSIDPLAYRANILSKSVLFQEKIKDLEGLTSPTFIAVGYGIKKLLPEWPMRFSRGQISWAEPQTSLNKAVSYGGYAIPLNDETLIGATHARLSADENPFGLSAKDDAKNLAQFEQFIGPAKAGQSASRASVRVTSSDTLPVIGQTAKGDYVLTGLGSRGFVFAPLLAESIVSHYYGDPMPIAGTVWQRFSVARLLSRSN